MTIPVSLGEARLVDENPSQIKSPDANAKGDLFYVNHMSLRGRSSLALPARASVPEAISYNIKDCFGRENTALAMT